MFGSRGEWIVLIVVLKQPSTFDKKWNEAHYGAEKGK